MSKTEGFAVVKDNDVVKMSKGEKYRMFVDRWSAQGKRKYMEDFNAVVYDPDTGIVFALICDGHGGDQVARQLVKIAPAKVLAILREAQGVELALRKSAAGPLAIRHHWMKVERSLKELMLDLDMQLYEQFKAEADPAGSTFVAVGVLPWVSRLVTINVGDSHLLMADRSRRVLFSTFEAKPNHSDEKKRIENAQGWVSADNRVNSNLALSRAFGDFTLKKSPVTGKYHPHDGPVSAMPTVEVWTFDDNLCWIVLTSDGITDVFPDKQIVRHVEKMHNRGIYPAQALVQESYTRGSGDNLTAIVIALEPNPTRSKGVSEKKEKPAE